MQYHWSVCSRAHPPDVPRVAKWENRWDCSWVCGSRMFNDAQPQIASDGESNWLEGAQLLAVYLILGMVFFFLPG